MAADALRPASWAAEKSHSLLVRHAYARAFCTVLAEEAGVTAEVCLSAETTPMSHLASAPSSTATPAPTGTLQGAESERAATA